MAFSDQLFFAKNISRWDERTPGIYHGHFAFIDLEKYSEDKSKKFLHINLIRKPLDRWDFDRALG